MDILDNVINPATSEKQDSIISAIEGNYAVQVDEATGSITYIGKAAIGSATSSAVWQIKKMDESTSPEVIITWADGDDSFNNVWDDRASLSYS